jgi:hypothetical protein
LFAAKEEKLNLAGQMKLFLTKDSGKIPSKNFDLFWKRSLFCHPGLSGDSPPPCGKWQTRSGARSLPTAPSEIPTISTACCDWVK